MHFATQSNGRGTMIDNIAVSELLPLTQTTKIAQSGSPALSPQRATRTARKAYPCRYPRFPLRYLERRHVADRVQGLSYNNADRVTLG